MPVELKSYKNWPPNVSANRNFAVEALVVIVNIVGQGIYPYQCDMGKPKEIEEMFKWIEANKDLGKLDICINNAACVWAKGLMEMNLEEMQAMLNVNVLGYNYATKLSIQSMMKHNVDDGQIIYVSSVLAHTIVPNPKIAYYSATKHALNCLLDGWRHELNSLGKSIRIGQISPGYIKTAAVEAQSGKEASDAFYGANPHLKCEDVVDGILHMLQTKPHIQTQDIVVRHIREDGKFDGGNSNFI